MEKNLMMGIESAIEALWQAESEDNTERIIGTLEAIRLAMNEGEMFIIPVELPENQAAFFDPDTVEAGDTVQLEEALHLKIRTIDLQNGETVFAVFTNREEAAEGAPTSTITGDIQQFLEHALMSPNTGGMIINPWGKDFFLSKEMIGMIFEGNLPAERENIICIDVVDAADTEAESIAPPYSGEGNNAELLRNHYWNVLEQVRFDDIHSIAFPDISTESYELSIEEVVDIALRTVSDWLKINPHYGMAIMFACKDEEACEIYRRIWDRYEASFEHREIIENDGKLLEEAIRFAVDCHSGAVRKGTEKPYILHPLETLQILASMDFDTGLMIAGLLHDTLEDTDASLLDIYDKFGVDVAALVNEHTEDKRQIWYMRKLHTVDALPKANIRHKILTLADKVANLRDMYADYQKIGDELWQRFNAPREMQAWYYSRLNDGLGELREYPETAPVYWEMTELYKDLFVDFLIDEEKERLYQLSASGEGYVFDRETLQWEPLEETLGEGIKLISRKEAESIEEVWRRDDVLD